MLNLEHHYNLAGAKARLEVAETDLREEMEHFLSAPSPDTFSATARTMREYRFAWEDLRDLEETEYLLSVGNPPTPAPAEVD